MSNRTRRFRCKNFAPSMFFDRAHSPIIRTTTIGVQKLFARLSTRVSPRPESEGPNSRQFFRYCYCNNYVAGGFFFLSVRLAKKKIPLGATGCRGGPRLSPDRFAGVVGTAAARSGREGNARSRLESPPGRSRRSVSPANVASATIRQL